MKALNGEAFLDFLKKLKTKMGSRKWFAQLDNCAVHFTKDIQAWSAEHRIPLVRGVPYMPQFQGIELFWA